MNSYPLQPVHQPNPAALEGVLVSAVSNSTSSAELELIQLRWEASYWKAQHTRAVEREEALKEEIKQKDAMIRDLNQRLYGKKSEKSKGKSEVNANTTGKTPKNPRGQAVGSVGHGRTVRSNLPIVHETILLSETACAICGLEYTGLPDEESNIIEVFVSAHVRRIHRQKCAKNCTCTAGAMIITAPAPAKLIPKSPFSNSVWEEILLNKFLHAQPINRILNDFKSLGLSISPGTVAGNLKTLTPLFKPVYEEFHQRQMTENRFHNDETRWEVYEPVEGKVGSRWYLWLTRSISVIYYRMDPTRSADVPIAHFADLVSKSIIIICDSYSAYKKLARLNLAVILAFCWVHVRRDFLELARSHVDLNSWGLDWVDKIGTLFHLNKLRVDLWNPTLPLAWQSVPFQESHKVLGIALTEMKSDCDALLLADKIAEENKEKSSAILATAQRKVLNSLTNHWKGLIVFYEHPDVKMDNNPAEQSVRNPVLGRKSYYGSGSIWSAELAAMIFSIFQTMLLWNLNPRTWLRLYLKACALNGGNAPQDLSEFLPWTMSESRKQQLSKPPKDDSS